MSADAASTVAELVGRRADDDRRGLVFEGELSSWREVVEAAEDRATMLEELRTDAPFHVGVLLENTPEYLSLLLGAAIARAVVVGLNPTRRGEALALDVRATDCQLIVTDTDGSKLLAGLDLGVGADRVLDCDRPGYGETRGTRRSAASRAAAAPDDLYLLIFTSGTTGSPKAVRMTQGRAARAATRVPFTGDDVLYAAMPLFHGNALSATIFPWLASGATLALRRRFSASGFLPDIRESGATFSSTVGRAIAHIVATPPTEHDRDHRLRYLLGPETAAPDKAEFTRRFGVPVIEGYGSSENAIVLLPVADPKPGALGRPRRGEDIAVVDPTTGEECPVAAFDESGALTNAADATGELVGRNVSSNFEGYYKNPEAEAARIRGGWYWSGDLAYRDDEGVFYFAGRAGDWLRVDSENFTAAPIERILARFEGTAGVAVYALPDARTGDQVAAAIELEAGVEFDPIAFEAFLAAQPDLGTKWAPRYVRVVASLPVTGTDKVDKAPLRGEQWSTTDPLWHRVGRSSAFVEMTATDVEGLRTEFVANGRANLLTG